MDFNHQLTIIQQTYRSSQSSRDSKIKQITSQKWRNIMFKCLERMRKKNSYDENLLDDLKLIVSSIKEEKFIQAILNLQPFRPKFTGKPSSDKKQKENIQNEQQFQHKYKTKLANSKSLDYRNSIMKFKQSINEKLIDSFKQIKQQGTNRKTMLQNLIHHVTEQLTLIKQFQNKNHPFKRIIEQFLFLLQNKYKNIIDSSPFIKIEDIQERLIIDIKLIQQFIVKSSEPYITLFKTQNQDQKIQFQAKMMTFIQQYIQKHEKLNIAIRKIMRMATKKNTMIKKLVLRIPDFVVVDNFDISQAFKIDGCYIQSMNALMEFCEAQNSSLSLEKLSQFRNCLVKDIDEYYAGQLLQNQREISAQTQIQILKFILSKLKCFFSDIFAQLKYLQVVYGQQDMSFKYDDSSYMYAQISVAIQALQLDFQ